jgi:hypothetical protein
MRHFKSFKEMKGTGGVSLPVFGIVVAKMGT